MTILTNVLRDRLSVVFCGTAVGPTSARVGAYRAGPGDQFLSVLYEIGLKPRRLEPQEHVTYWSSGSAKKTSGTGAEINDIDDS